MPIYLSTVFSLPTGTANPRNMNLAEVNWPVGSPREKVFVLCPAYRESVAAIIERSVHFKASRVTHGLSKELSLRS